MEGGRKWTYFLMYLGQMILICHSLIYWTRKSKLAELINEFTDLFSGELGCTSVVQQILTEGSPSRQPVRCVPVALQEVVNAEVSKMHVMWLSHSPGLLLMISES